MQHMSLNNGRNVPVYPHIAEYIWLHDDSLVLVVYMSHNTWQFKVGKLGHKQLHGPCKQYLNNNYNGKLSKHWNYLLAPETTKYACRLHTYIMVSVTFQKKQFLLFTHLTHCLWVIDSFIGSEVHWKNKYQE